MIQPKHTYFNKGHFDEIIIYRVVLCGRSKYYPLHCNLNVQTKSEGRDTSHVLSPTVTIAAVSELAIFLSTLLLEETLQTA